MPKKTTLVPMPSRRKTILLSRLRTIEGHVRGIIRMVEADAFCPEVLAQAVAVQRAIDRFSLELLEHHLETCFVTAVRGESQQDRKRALRELLDIFQTSAKLKRARHPRAPVGDDGLPTHQTTSKAGRSGLPARGPDGR